MNKIINKNIKKIFVVGDLHGDFEVYSKILEDWHKERDKNANIVFLGDYGDRGSKSVEIIESLISFKDDKSVIMLKGNHEDYIEDGTPTFWPCSLREEITKKRGNYIDYFDTILYPFFDSLYTSAMLPGKVLFVHGGISTKINNMKSLENPSKELLKDLLWSDPIEYPIGERINDNRGIGVEFDKNILDTVMERLNVKLVVRSHQPDLANNGPYIFNNKMATLSSTSYYGGKPHYLIINTDNLEYSTKFI